MKTKELMRLADQLIADIKAGDIGPGFVFETPKGSYLKVLPNKRVVIYQKGKAKTWDLNRLEL